MKSLDGSVINYMEDYIEETFVYFKENKYMEEKLKLTDIMIKSASEKKNDWKSDRLVGYWVKRHLDGLAEMNVDKSEIDAFCHKYWNVPEIRNFSDPKLLEQMTKEEIDEAKRNIEKSFIEICPKGFKKDSYLISLLKLNHLIYKNKRHIRKNSVK